MKRGVMKVLIIALISVLFVSCVSAVGAEQEQVDIKATDIQLASVKKDIPYKLPSGDVFELQKISLEEPAEFHISPISRQGAREYVAWSRTPELIKVYSPAYPRLARNAGVEGRILLCVTVGSYGNVEAVSILNSDVTPAMEKAAIDAVLQFEFEPAMQRDVAVKSQMAVPVWFRLR